MILIQGGRVIGPAEGIDMKADVVLDGGRIAANGMIVAPGLVDVHVHFRDPGLTYKEDIHTGAKAAAKGGFTTVVCMANTKPIVDNEETLRYVLEEGKKDGNPRSQLRCCIQRF